MAEAKSQKVLVIEDDPNTANLVVLYLEKEGFQALQANQGDTGLALAKAHAPDLVILDLMLPKMSGWEVCRQLRKFSNAPVIMLTARGEEDDRVEGLALGADDYVVKPFSPRELVARVKANLRRVAPVSPQAKVLACGEVRLDLDKRRLHVGQRDVELTPHEYALLEALMSSPGRTFVRDELLDRLYPNGEAVVIDRVVDVHIGKLRQKIESNPAKPIYILTARGLGYRFTDKPMGDGSGDIH